MPDISSDFSRKLLFGHTPDHVIAKSTKRARSDFVGDSGPCRSADCPVRGRARVVEFSSYLDTTSTSGR